MRFAAKTITTALLVALGLTSASALAWEKDKTYKITILHTNDHHGHFWRNEYSEYGLAAQKTLVDSVRKEVAAEGAACCCCPAATLTPVCRNLTCRMLNRTFAA